jgi:alpha-L-arabinofuranosidase
LRLSGLGSTSNAPNRYAELIRNRAFQSDTVIAASLAPWTAFGGATLTLQTTNPSLSSALPRSVNVKGNANAETGISNPGFWGIEVTPQMYTGSFYVMGAYTGTFNAGLRGSSSGSILASANITSTSVAGSWTKHTFSLMPTSSAGTANVFTLTFTPTTSSQTVNFGLISLFPETYGGRPNGLRKDIMAALKDLNPSFFRIPGGNNLEGGRSGNEWKWGKTLGDLTTRPGRSGTWGYYNTDGIGLIEYMLVCPLPK